MWQLPCILITLKISKNILQLFHERSLTFLYTTSIFTYISDKLSCIDNSFNIFYQLGISCSIYLWNIMHFMIPLLHWSSLIPNYGLYPFRSKIWKATLCLVLLDLNLTSFHHQSIVVSSAHLNLQIFLVPHFIFLSRLTMCV